MSIGIRIFVMKDGNRLMGIADNFADAKTIFDATSYKLDSVLCVSVPRSRYALNLAQAKEFFDEQK